MLALHRGMLLCVGGVYAGFVALNADLTVLDESGLFCRKLSLLFLWVNFSLISMRMHGVVCCIACWVELQQQYMYTYNVHLAADLM